MLPGVSALAVAGLCPPAGEEGPKSVSNLAGVSGELSGSRPDILAQWPNVTRHETVIVRQVSTMNISLHSS